MGLAHTYALVVERIQIHMANNYPTDDSSLSDNQVLLYLEAALAYNLVGQMYGNAKLEGTLSTPESFISTFELTDLHKNEITGDWEGNLPQPPLSLPLGYSITDAYFASAAGGVSEPIGLVRSKRKSYRPYLPRPNGCLGWVKGKTFVVNASNGQSLAGQRLFVEMISTRAQNMTDEINASDDVIETSFQYVVKMILQRVSTPQDVVDDNLPAGPKPQ